MAQSTPSTPSASTSEFESHIDVALTKSNIASAKKNMPTPDAKNLVKVKLFISAVTGRPYYQQDLWANQCYTEFANGNVVPTGSATCDAPSLPDEAKTTLVFNDKLGLRHATIKQVMKYGWGAYMMIDITTGNLYPIKK